MDFDETNVEMTVSKMVEPTVARNAALVTCNAVESNKVMTQRFALMTHSIDHALLLPSANQLNGKYNEI